MMTCPVCYWLDKVVIQMTMPWNVNKGTHQYQCPRCKFTCNQDGSID